MGLIYLTAKSVNGQNFANPRVVAFESNALSYAPGKSGRTEVLEYLGHSGIATKTAVVYESAAEIQAQILNNAGQATNMFAKAYITTPVAGAGANQGAATAITKYLNEVTSSTAGSAEGVRLDASAVSKVRVIINNAAAIVKVYPATGEKIGTSASTVNASVDLAINARKHYVCLTAGIWTVADDYTSVN